VNVVACADVTAQHVAGQPIASRLRSYFKPPTSTFAIIHGPCLYTFSHAAEHMATVVFNISVKVDNHGLMLRVTSQCDICLGWLGLNFPQHT
jgi:hypothetical protein